jgi:hypothetical protein
MKNRRVSRSVTTDRFPQLFRDRPLRLRDPVDLLAAVPFLLGYHPSDSLVVVGVHRQSFVMSVRYDLPPPDADAEAYLRTHLDDPAPVLRSQGVSVVLLVGYGAPERVAPSMRWLLQTYRQAGLQVIEALHMHEGRFRSVLCADTGCCPAEGTRFEPRDTRVAAECTVAGRVALPDRDSYEAQLRPLGGPARQAMRRAAVLTDERLYELMTHPPEQGTVERVVLAEGRTALTAAEDRLRRGERLDDDEVAWLATLMKVTPVRDLAWARITGSRDTMLRLRELWLDVLRRCQPDVSVPPLCLFAFAAWRCGEGALARLALETALDLNPSYTMATEALYPMVVSGLPPSVMMRGFPWGMLRPRPGSRPRRRSGSRRAGSRQE